MTTPTVQPDSQAVDEAQPTRPSTLDRIPPAWRTMPVAIAAGVAVLLVVGLVLVLATRPSGTVTPTDQETTAGAPAADPADEPEGTATIGQYAGIVNANAVDIRQTAEEYDEDYCSIEEIADRVGCGLKAMLLQVQADLLVLQLNGAMDPDSLVQIGPPPDEIAALVDDTIADAQAVSDAFDASDPTKFAFSLAVDRLVSTLNRWEPYL